MQVCKKCNHWTKTYLRPNSGSQGHLARYSNVVHVVYAIENSNREAVEWPDIFDDTTKEEYSAEAQQTQSPGDVPEFHQLLDKLAQEVDHYFDYPETNSVMGRTDSHGDPELDYLFNLTHFTITATCNCRYCSKLLQIVLDSGMLQVFFLFTYLTPSLPKERRLKMSSV